MTRPTISIQAAIGPGDPPSNVFILDESLLDGPDVLAGPEIVGQGSWVELADRCFTVSTRRGRQRLLEQYQAGTCGAVFDNTDGTLDPAWTEGPYSNGSTDLLDHNGQVLTDHDGRPLWTGDGSGRTSTLQPMRAIRASFFHRGEEYPFFYGYIDRWVVNPGYPEGGTVSVSATDAFKIFTRIDPLEQPPIGDGEDTGARINRILDLADWSTVMRDIDTGDNTHQPTTLAQPIATQMRLASDSERGDLYVDARGFPTFRRRLSRYTAFRSLVSQWTIGDGDGEFNPAEWSEPVADDDLVRNDVNVARVGGSMVSRRSPEGEIAYLRSTYTRTDLTLEDDLQVADHAERVLRLFKDPRYRIDSVVLEPDGFDDDDLWSLVVGALFADRVTANLRRLDTGVLFSGDNFVEGIDHDIPVLGPGQWRTTFSLADASGFPTNPFILDVSLLDGTAVLV